MITLHSDIIMQPQWLFDKSALFLDFIVRSKVFSFQPLTIPTSVSFSFLFFLFSQKHNNSKLWVFFSLVAYLKHYWIHHLNVFGYAKSLSPL